MIQTGKVWVAAVAIALATVVAPATTKAQAPQGTGFYIRADLGLAISGQADTRDDNCGSPNPFFGCGTSLDSSAGTSIAVGGGVGYRVAKWFRTDFTLTYRPMFDLDGTVTRAGTPDRAFEADVTSWNGMLNGYVDIAGFFPKGKLGIFHPYAGAGLGFAVNSIDDVSAGSPFTPGIRENAPSGTAANFAWMITAGTGLHVGNGVIVDLGYKFTDLGSFTSDAGTACAGAACRNVDAITGDLHAHELSVGVRIGF